MRRIRRNNEDIKAEEHGKEKKKKNDLRKKKKRLRVEFYFQSVHFLCIRNSEAHNECLARNEMHRGRLQLPRYDYSAKLTFHSGHWSLK